MDRTKRFRRYIREHPDMHEDIFILRRGQQLPTHAEMDEMERNRLPYDIDPEIRQPVLELNRQGYRTCMSCAGHPSASGPNYRGYIGIGYGPKERTGTTVIRPAAERRIKEILESQGLKRVNVEPSQRGRQWVPVTFTGVGSKTNVSVRWLNQGRFRNRGR